MNVLLDLDNTLINALEEHERTTLSNEFQTKFDYKDMLIYGYRIYARPGLQPFLDYLFENFNVSVFTAAEQEYALFIITKPERKIHYFFFRYHVDIALKRYDGMKDLRILFHLFKLPNFFPCNTVIIDDLDQVQESNPLHTIRINSFDVSKDNEVKTESINDNDLNRVKIILEDLRKRFETSGCARQIYLGQEPTIASPFLL